MKRIGSDSQASQGGIPDRPKLHRGVRRPSCSLRRNGRPWPQEFERDTSPLKEVDFCAGALDEEAMTCFGVAIGIVAAGWAFLGCPDYAVDPRFFDAQSPNETATDDAGTDATSDEAAGPPRVDLTGCVLHLGMDEAQ